MAVLAFLSKDLELPEQIEDTGISRVFLKISLLIYNALGSRTKLFSGEKIRLYLKTLEQKKDLKGSETEYFIRKISIVLLMATAGSFLSFMMSLSVSRSGNITEEGALIRSEYGERETKATLTASDEEGNEIGEYDFLIKNRVYTDEEADALFEEASKVLEKTVLAENVSFDEVRSDLDLCESIEGYPFRIRWRVDNYDVMHFDGRLIEEMIPEEGVLVTMTAEISYGEKLWQQDLYAYILPKTLSPLDKTINGIGDLLSKADEESEYKEEIILPTNYEGEKIIWSEKVKDNSLMILMLTLIGGAASFVLKDRELKNSMEKRNDQMLRDYPQFVSQLVLYMGAGMSMRNIFSRLSGIYLSERKNGADKRYLYEEITRTNRELSAGMSEAAAYENLGLRCSSQQYTRLTTILSQNQRKGNSEVLKQLKEESSKAFEERMDKVRKAGEEAGTKLLMPMIIMLVIVMVIIMIPAYSVF